MKLIVLSAILAIPWVNAMPPEQVDAIRVKVTSAKRAELPFVVSRLVRSAKPSDREETKAIAIGAVVKKRPAALRAVLDEIAANRPPTTPGNEHGQRPTDVPHNYGTP